MSQNNAILKSFLRGLLWKIHPALFHRVVCYYGQVFSIGIYEGKDLFSLEGAKNVMNPVLSAKDIHGVPAAFVADPFVIHTGPNWYLFFELYNKATRRGEIGLATSQDGLKWSYACTVLREPFHLSYPCVFEWDNHYYMIPESYCNGVRLYKAKQFPRQWEFVGFIIDKKGLVDSSIFCFERKWWLFSAQSHHPQLLCLFWADKPTGPWLEHQANLIATSNNNVFRPAGKVLQINGRPIRFVQDGIPEYGSSVRAFEITEISSTTYQERELRTEPILSGGSHAWNAGGMHHIDAHLLPGGNWIAYVDGWYRKAPNN